MFCELIVAGTIISISMWICFVFFLAICFSIMKINNKFCKGGFYSYYFKILLDKSIIRKMFSSEVRGSFFLFCCNTTGRKTGCDGSSSDISVASGFSSPSDLQ